MPATIGILGGEARVGLSPEELVELASTAEKKNALKVSRRDLGYICGLVGGMIPLIDTHLTVVGAGWQTPSWGYNGVWHDGARALGGDQDIRHWWTRWCASRRRELHGHLRYVQLWI